MQVSIHAAKTNLSKLIEAVAAGEEVVIARGKTPVARLVPFQERTFKIGLRDDTLAQPLPDFLEPSGEDDLTAWEGGA
ncbi:prevent-host-death protein [Prosthecomicrobium hirschii]|uniref:Antitoxin n=1 Tax=Prosthecodimorpha hirschii TaxID=665126 RepID=A0A0P6WDY7_9HYPH|nr:type II toxin-antitoxin system prevent-host-death family antitoxin [Prosthecomicrobium hirschii]KPL54679.1 prevent-host-death protein [Prosthecomicrobium hirschii]